MKIAETVNSKAVTSVPQVAIVITNWNGRHYLELCLSSIAAQEFQDFELFVVDNASTDGSVEMLQNNYPHVRLIQNESNLGLCAANNQGIRATDAEFVLILNNDTELEPEFLGRLVEAIKSDPEIGMVASKMLLTDHRTMIESAGIVVDRTGIAWGLKSGDTDDKADVAPSPVFGACGGAALYRRKMLLEIDLFDADFFVYLEDADVAWRGQWAGWKCVYVPDAVVYHAHSATIKEGSPFKTRLLGRNKIWLIAKNYPFPHLIWYLPFIIIYELLAIIYLFLKGSGVHILKGRFEGIRQIPKMLSRRQKLVKKVSSRAMHAKLHPMENPVTLWRRQESLFSSVNSHYKQSEKQ